MIFHMYAIPTTVKRAALSDACHTGPSEAQCRFTIYVSSYSFPSSTPQTFPLSVLLKDFSTPGTNSWKAMGIPAALGALSWGTAGSWGFTTSTFIPLAALHIHPALSPSPSLLHAPSTVLSQQSKATCFPETLLQPLGQLPSAPHAACPMSFLSFHLPVYLGSSPEPAAMESPITNAPYPQELAPCKFLYLAKKGICT